jgi:hypothetical protein
MGCTIKVPIYLNNLRHAIESGSIKHLSVNLMI